MTHDVEDLALAAAPSRLPRKRHIFAWLFASATLGFVLLGSYFVAFVFFIFTMNLFGHRGRGIAQDPFEDMRQSRQRNYINGYILGVGPLGFLKDDREQNFD